LSFFAATLPRNFAMVMGSIPSAANRAFSKRTLGNGAVFFNSPDMHHLLDFDHFLNLTDLVTKSQSPQNGSH
jgi:hypothetical protein